MYKDIGLWRETYQEAPAAPGVCVSVCAFTVFQEVGKSVFSV